MRRFSMPDPHRALSWVAPIYAISDALPVEARYTIFARNR